MSSVLIGIVIGIVAGVVSAQMLWLQWTTLIPWGIIGIALGYWATRSRSASTGIAYGFFLSISFLIAQYTGPRPLASILPAFLAASVFGALCGFVLTWIGAFVRQRFSHSE